MQKKWNKKRNPKRSSLQLVFLHFPLEVLPIQLQQTTKCNTTYETCTLEFVYPMEFSQLSVMPVIYCAIDIVFA